MCGIAGIVSLGGDEIDRGALQRMMASLSHRGPDGSGVFRDRFIQLGHRRLSILDPTDAGAQPMERHGRVIVHNGEIYNYLELADELRVMGYSFSTETDTEVILAAYDAWGVDATRRFNGIWAFAIWDRERRRLVLSRDRVGVKPLYLRQSHDYVAFASEVTAIGDGAVPHDSWRQAPHPPAVRDFLVRGLVDHSDFTFIDGVIALPPAHSLIADRGGVSRHRYWAEPELSDDARVSVHGTDLKRDQSLVDEFVWLFDDAIKLQLRSDVALGTCLSGGIDSSSIVATTTRVLDALASAGAIHSGHEQAPRYAFHARFPAEGVDESRWADIVAGRAALELIATSPRVESFRDAIAPVLRAQGEPFASSSVFAQFAVMRAAAENRVKVLLDGQGGDELLAGYLPYLGYRVADLVRTGSLGAARHELHDQVARGMVTPAAAVRQAARAFAPRAVVERTRSASRGRLGLRVTSELDSMGTLVRSHKRRGTLLSNRLWQDFISENLPALLRYEDRNSMAFGIEARVPFLDHRIVELCMAMPDRLKVSGGRTKVALRSAMTSRLPTDVVDRRDKVGFATPQRAWLSNSRREIESLLGGGAQIVERGWVERAEVNRVMALSGGAGDSQLWRLIVTELWLQDRWPSRLLVAAVQGDAVKPAAA